MLKKITNKLRPELNFLLTEPPFMAEEGLDFGWFCREHSFCMLIISSIFQIKMNIVIGDIFVFSGNSSSKFLTTLSTNSDHSWCTAPNNKIIDLSICLDWFEGYPKLHKPILNTGKQNEPYVVKNITKHFDVNDEHGSEPFIGYNEVSLIPHSPKDLLIKPLLLLRTQESANICLSICLFCYHLIHEKEKSIINNISQPEAIRNICNKYRNPVKELYKLL